MAGKIADMIYYLLAAFVVCAILYFLSVRRADVHNAATIVYSTFVGVWPVYPLTPFDDSVQARTEAIQETFAAHGNTMVEVIPYMYSLPIGKDPTAGVSYAQFLQMCHVDYMRRVQEFNAKKLAKDNEAAAVYLAGQRSNQNFTTN